jgi:vancomycin resistance protein YoaR
MEKLKELLGEELFNQVKEKLGDTKIMIDDGNFIPKSRFDQVNEQKKEYKKMLEERDKQLKDLSEKAKGNEELQNKIKELEEANKKSADEYEKKIKEQAFNFALENSLRDNKAKNIKAVMALLDLDEIKQDGDKLLGLDTQLEKLRDSDPYLFEDESTTTSTGSQGNFGKKTSTLENNSTDDFMKAIYENQAKRN